MFETMCIGFWSVVLLVWAIKQLEKMFSPKANVEGSIQLLDLSDEQAYNSYNKMKIDVMKGCNLPPEFVKREQERAKYTK